MTHEELEAKVEAMASQLAELAAKDADAKRVIDEVLAEAEAEPAPMIEPESGPPKAVLGPPGPPAWMVERLSVGRRGDDLLAFEEQLMAFEREMAQADAELDAELAPFEKSGDSPAYLAWRKAEEPASAAYYEVCEATKGLEAEIAAERAAALSQNSIRHTILRGHLVSVNIHRLEAMEEAGDVVRGPPRAIAHYPIPRPGPDAILDAVGATGPIIKAIKTILDKRANDRAQERLYREVYGPRNRASAAIHAAGRELEDAWKVQTDLDHAERVRLEAPAWKKYDARMLAALEAFRAATAGAPTVAPGIKVGDRVRDVLEGGKVVGPVRLVRSLGVAGQGTNTGEPVAVCEWYAGGALQQCEILVSHLQVQADQPA